ncbi:RsiV family protein [Mitsuokella multacida]|uniref:RsiV family protein n=1 Tax=Mitsuokella multacida TaxID=52226 RepID=UPI0022E9288F|nr:RsiV family protein [Mitsuokella multacida]
MKHLGKNLGRTLAVALLVGAGSVISAVSALPDYLQAAETASAADKRQECIQEVAGSNPVTVRQHEVVLKDHQGRELYTGKYLELAAKNGAGHDVRRALARWNDAERMRWAGDEKMLSDAVHFTEENGLPMYAPYYMGHAIADWGRVDAEVLSFCTRTESYTGGAHPNHAYQSWTLDLRTGEPIALRDIVASRRDFLTAVAAAFRAKYPGREDETFRRTIDAQLESIYPYLDWDKSTVWTMLPEGGIRVYFSAYELAPYAAGDFILTLTPEANPGLFKVR